MTTNHMPLIGQLLWPDDELRQINNLMKRIARIFVFAISQNHKPNYVSVLLRLLNLIYITVEQCDNHIREAGKIEYPFESELGKKFNEMFYRIISGE